MEGPNYLPSLDTNPPYLETRGLPRSAANVQRTSGMSALYRLTSCFSIEDALFGNETLKGAQGIFQETFSEGVRRAMVTSYCFRSAIIVAVPSPALLHSFTLLCLALPYLTVT